MSRAAALERIANQPGVRAFLTAAVEEDRVDHAYLFVGVPGSGKTEAAQALASCIVCPNGGDGDCDECIRVSHRTHPDVRYVEPAGVSGYLVSQVHELIEDVYLTPVRGRAKVYIITRADLLRAAAANALLKTIEEPPPAVYFILIARSADACLPTIVSRCQQIPFRVVPPAEAAAELSARTGAGQSMVRVALAVAGTPERAEEWLASADRRELRRLAVRSVSELAADDDWDVLLAAKAIVEAAKIPLGALRIAQEEALAQDEEFLSKQALKKIEEANKRELSARERSGMMEALSAVESLLRDCLIELEGIDEPIVNEDQSQLVARIAQESSTAQVLSALDAVRRAGDDLDRNVSPQLAIEAMLLSVKEALTCPPSSR